MVPASPKAALGYLDDQEWQHRIYDAVLATLPSHNRQVVSLNEIMLNRPQGDISTKEKYVQPEIREM